MTKNNWFLYLFLLGIKWLVHIYIRSLMHIWFIAHERIITLKRHYLNN